MHACYPPLCIVYKNIILLFWEDYVILSTKSEQTSRNVRKKSHSKLFPYFLIPTVVKPEIFSSAKSHGVLTTMCPCHHESPNDLTRKYDFYVYPNSIMTFFSKVNISHFFNDKKEADKSSQPLFLTLQTNQFSPLSSFFAFSIWYFTWSNPVPPKEFRLWTAVLGCK